MSAEFKWQNPNKLLSDLTAMLRDRGVAISRVPGQAVRRGTFELLAIVQRLTPKKTGTLVRSETAEIRQVDASTVEGRVGTWLKYAPYVEFGTGIYGPRKRPILIVAKNTKGLFWGAYDAGGNPIIRRSVKVLGMKPRSMFGDAVEQFLPRYGDIVRQELAKEARQ